MNSLFYIAAYNHARAEWTRFLVSSQYSEDAINQVRKHLEVRWSIRTTVFVCMTPDNIFMEL